MILLLNVTLKGLVTSDRVSLKDLTLLETIEEYYPPIMRDLEGKCKPAIMKRNSIEICKSWIQLVTDFKISPSEHSRNRSTLQ